MTIKLGIHQASFVKIIYSLVLKFSSAINDVTLIRIYCKNNNLFFSVLCLFVNQLLSQSYACIVKVKKSYNFVFNIF